MSVMKFDKTPTPLEEVIKINEIIDNLGSGGGVGIRREEFTSSDWVEQQNGKYRYTIYGIKDVISVYRLYNGDYAFVGCDITNDDDNAYIDSPNAFDGFAYVASQEEVLGNRNIGAIIKSLIPQNDAGLHLLDGSLIQGDGIYSEFVNHMASLYGDGTNIPNYFTSESNWQNEVITYGCCGKFVYDSENNTIRLPKFERILQGTLLESELGDRIEAGAPNITGTLYYNGVSSENPSKSGAFKDTTYTHYASWGGSGTGVKANISFDASDSNSVYGNSDTVQPPAIKVLYYIVIATSTKTEIEVDIDNIVNDLDRKADKNLSNTGCITNCLTSIPQDIKLELNDNKTITIKAGTKCYIPNGFKSDGTTRKFDEYIYPTDYICQCPNSIGDFFLLPVIGNNYERHSGKNATFSGPTQPTITVQLGIWYDTTNNVIKMTNDTGSTWIEQQIALPIAMERCITANEESSITQVFNGFGFIDSLAYVLPGVKGLIPYGRNEDGSLKNLECNITKVMIQQNNVKYSGHIAIISGYMDLAHTDWYNEIENQNYVIDPETSKMIKYKRCIAGDFVKGENGKIISLTPKTTFHAVDYNDISSLFNSVGIPDVSSRIIIASGYVTVSDGWITYLGSSNDTSQYLNIDGVRIVQNYGSRGDWVDSTSAQMPVKKGATIEFVGTCYFYPYIEE